MKSIHSPVRERRHFPRVHFRSHATLATTRSRWPVHIMDLSFNGALAALIHKHDIEAGEEMVLTIEKDDGQTLKMQGKLSHQKEHFLGIECRANGIDNQAQLRELLRKYQNKEFT